MSSSIDVHGRAAFPVVRKVKPDGFPSNVKFPPIVPKALPPVKVSRPEFAPLWAALLAKHAREQEEEQLEELRHKLEHMDMSKNLVDQGIADSYNKKLEQLRFISGSDERKLEELQNHLSGLPFPQHVVNDAINRVNRERVQSQINTFGRHEVHASRVVHGETRPRRREDELLGDLFGRRLGMTPRPPSAPRSRSSSAKLPSLPPLSPARTASDDGGGGGGGGGAGVLGLGTTAASRVREGVRAGMAGDETTRIEGRVFGAIGETKEEPIGATIPIGFSPAKASELLGSAIGKLDDYSTVVVYKNTKTGEIRALYLDPKTGTKRNTKTKQLPLTEFQKVGFRTMPSAMQAIRYFNSKIVKK